MGVPLWPFLAALLLLASHRLQCSPLHPVCPIPCLCQGGPLLNCSSSGLSLAPQHVLSTVTEVDLSHNLLKSLTLRWPNNHLRNVWLANNTITHLSLCVKRTTGSQYVRGGRPHYSTPWGKQACVSWAPALQLLSVERNQLAQFPDGLQGSGSLQILQLSYNRISSLQPGDLSHLQHLKELYLHHNFITSIHPQALKDLIHLKVLDLSFNSLITLTPMTYLSLRNTGAEVDMHGIRWQCDCRMRSVKRWMAYDSDRGQPTWSMVCASPFAVSGRDLLQLEDDDLICINVEDRLEHHQDVTVDRGSQILLPCPTYQDSKWCTPNGEMSANQSQTGLLISNITEKDAGLYVCVSESNQDFLTVFNLQIKKIGEIKGKNRIPRDLLEDTPVIPKSISQRMDQQSKQTNTQSDLALAVGLSVFITFLVAFILGVIARPFIDVLWSKVCTKKRSFSANPVSSTPMPSRRGLYENEAYCSEEEPEETETYRERRVTFSIVDSNENRNMAPCYTVGSEMIRENAVKDGESTKTKEGSLGVSGSISQQRRPDRALSNVTDPGLKKSIKIEHIPDPGELENRGGLISSSSSSSTSISVTSDKNQKNVQVALKDHLVPQSSELVKDPFQQRSHSPKARPSELPKKSIDSKHEIPRLTSKPLADWSPHTDNSDSGENFEFPESIRSSLTRSSSNFSSFDNSNQNVPQNLRYSNPSTSSSSISGDEPTEYTVNPYEEDEIDEANDDGPSLSDLHINCPNITVRSQPPANLAMTESDSSTSQSEAEIADLKLEQKKDRIEVGITIQEPEPQWPDLDFQTLPKIKKRLNIKAPSPPPNSFGSANETTNIKDALKQSEIVSQAQETRWPSLDFGSLTHLKRYLDIKPLAPTPDSSPSSSENEDCKKGSTVKLGKPNMDFPSQWKDLEPSLNVSVPHINISPDSTAPSPPAANITIHESDSSTSESEAEMTDHKVKQRKDSMEVGITSQEPEAQWPDLDFQSLPKIKKRLDITAPSPQPNSFDSANETTDHLVKPEKGELDLNVNNSLNQSEIVSQAPETSWPSLDLGSVIHLKRYLDIKPLAPTPDSSSSSSENEDGKKGSAVKLKRGKLAANINLPESDSSTGESEAEMTDHKVKQKKDSMEVGITIQEPEPQWPDLDFQSLPKTKKRLDIKAPSPPPISFESPNETTGHQVKQDKEACDMVNIPSEIVSYVPATRWPSLDLDNVTHIKRYLDIKPPAIIPMSSSSISENDNYKKDSTVKLERGNPNMNFPSQEPETKKPDPCLGVPQLQRRLDIKAPSPQPGLAHSGVTSVSTLSDSDFSSSESERENSNHKGQMKREVHGIKLENYTSIKDNFEDKTTSQNISPDHESPWAGLNLGFSRFRKHLGIRSKKDASPKVLSSPPYVSSSSSSGSGDESEGNDVKQQTAETGVSPDSTTPSPPAANITFTGSDSSTSESEVEMTDHNVKQKKDRIEVGITCQEPEPQWPDLDFQSIPKIKKCLDIKVPSLPSDSFRSPKEITDHQLNQKKEECDMINIPSEIVSHAAETIWPTLDLGSLTHIKRGLDMNPPSPKPDSSSSSSESEDGKSDLLVKCEKARPYVGFPNQEPETKRPAPSLGVHQLRRHLDIKPPQSALSITSQNDAAPKVPLSPPPASSCSESEDESEGHRVKQQRVGFGVKEITYIASAQDERSLRYKKRLDIKVPGEAPPPPPPSRQPTKSFTNSENENETTHNTNKGWRQTVHQPGGTVKVSPQNFVSFHPSNVSTESETSIDNSQTIKLEEESMWCEVNVSSVSRVKRYLDIKAPAQYESYSSSKSEDETTDYRVEQERDSSYVGIINHDREPKSDFSLGIPRIQRYLNIETETLSPQTTASISSNTESKTGSQTQDGMDFSFNDVVRRMTEQARHIPNVDLPPEIRWNGIGRYLKDLSVTSQRRQLDVSIQPTQEAPRMVLDHKVNSSSSSTDEIELRAKSEDRRGGKGLSALKTLSSERRGWDKGHEMPK